MTRYPERAAWRKGIRILLLMSAALACGLSLHAAAKPLPDIGALQRDVSLQVAEAKKQEAIALIDAGEYRSRAEYARWQRAQTRAAFEWHALSTRIIFIMVVSIVAFGMFLTYVQFRRDHRLVRDVLGPDPMTPPDAGPAPLHAASSTLKISATGVEISSQVIGLLLLAFSLAFFYLYLKNVYPIQLVDSRQEASQTAPAAKAP
jgi:hypothetical protein